MSDQRLFISHASEDDAVVGRIVAYLEANGRPCWIASRDIPPQSIYADAIAEGMQECAACVVILSAASNQSKAVKRELELASHYDKPFIPIRTDASEPARGFDYYLRNAQWLDYGRNGERALDRIFGRSAAPLGEPARVAPSTAASAPEEEDGTPLVLLVGGVIAVIAMAIWALAVMQPAATTTTEIASEAAPAPRPTPTTAPEGQDDCGLAAHSYLLGAPGSAIDRSALPPGTRIISPDSQVTMDYSAQRLNVELGLDGKVTGLWCG